MRRLIVAALAAVALALAPLPEAESAQTFNVAGLCPDFEVALTRSGSGFDVSTTSAAACVMSKVPPGPILVAEPVDVYLASDVTSGADLVCEDGSGLGTGSLTVDWAGTKFSLEGTMRALRTGGDLGAPPVLGLTLTNVGDPLILAEGALAHTGGSCASGSMTFAGPLVFADPSLSSAEQILDELRADPEDTLPPRS